MKAACLVSGGKDSIYASLVARDHGWDVTHYVTLQPQDEAPLLYHRPNVRWVALQARCAGVDHVMAPAGPGDDAEVAALRDALTGLDIDGVVSGALASEYQRTRIEAVGHALGLKTFMPLWHHDRVRHVRDLVDHGIQSLVVHVAGEGLGREWLGRRLDREAADELVRLHKRTGVDPAGEGGEYETFVVDAPHFGQRIQVDESHGTWHRDAGTLDILRARLAFKTRSVDAPNAA